MARFAELQCADRRALLEELKTIYQSRADSLDSAMCEVVVALDDYLEIARQLDAAGFEQAACGFVAKPPLTAGGILVGEQSLESWRRERERIADMRIAFDSARALNPKPAHVAAPARPAIERPDPEYRPKPRRATKKVDGSIPFGYSKIIILRNEVELNNTQCVIGDELIVTTEVANMLARNGAVEIERAAE